MNQKTLILTLLFSIFIFSLVPPVDSYFTRSHEYWVLKTLEDEPDSLVAKLCGDTPELLLDGNTGSDIFVLHYTDSNKVKSYIFLHQKASFDRCLEEAGTDTTKKCICYGIGSHSVGDGNAHIEMSVVPKYIRKFFTSNLVGHMAIENNYEIKHMDLIKDESIVTSGTLEFHDANALNTFFEETGGSSENLEIYSELSGLSFSEVQTDARIFRAGYVGEGFYNTVYNEKVSLPSLFWIIGIIPTIVGLLGALILIIFFRNTTRWKWILIGTFMIMALVGILLLTSLYFGTTWEWIRLSLSIIPIKVSDADVKLYNEINLESHKDFFRTGVLVNDDVSGLSYYDKQGKFVEGELGKAEVPFKFFMVLGILPLFILFYIFLFYKTFIVKPKKGSKINKLINVIGWFLLFILLVAFALWLFLIFLG